MSFRALVQLFHKRVHSLQWGWFSSQNDRRSDPPWSIARNSAFLVVGWFTIGFVFLKYLFLQYFLTFPLWALAPRENKLGASLSSLQWIHPVPFCTVTQSPEQFVYFAYCLLWQNIVLLFCCIFSFVFSFFFGIYVLYYCVLCHVSLFVDFKSLSSLVLTRKGEGPPCPLVYK